MVQIFLKEWIELMEQLVPNGSCDHTSPSLILINTRVITLGLYVGV